MRRSTARMGWRRFFWQQFREDLTPAGRSLVAGLCLAGLGTVTVVIPIYQVFFALVGLVVVSAVAGFVLRPRVTVSGCFPDRAVAGETVTGRFRIENSSRWPVYDLGLGLFGLPRAIEIADPIPAAHLPPGASIEIPITLRVQRRGVYELPPLRVFTTFPFELARSGWTRHFLEPLTVVPSFRPLAEFSVPTGNRYQPRGIAFSSQIGESQEYMSNREYVEGEPIRRLDFRSWARLGKPVVREYQDEYFSRIALILDTWLPPNRGPLVLQRWPGHGILDRLWSHRTKRERTERFEAAVSLTAAIADAVSDGEYILDLFAAGPRLYTFRTGRHTAPLDSLLEILACVEPAREDPFDELIAAVSEELEHVSTVVCVLLDWDASRRRLARLLLESDAECRLLLVGREDPPASVEPELAPFLRVVHPEQIARGGLLIQ